jgi:transposase
MIATASSSISLSPPHQARHSAESKSQDAARVRLRARDFALYCERNLVERFFNIIKHFRAIATRYEKTARNFLAGVHLVCALAWLK